MADWTEHADGTHTARMGPYHLKVEPADGLGHWLSVTIPFPRSGMATARQTLPEAKAYAEEWARKKMEAERWAKGKG